MPTLSNDTRLKQTVWICHDGNCRGHVRCLLAPVNAPRVEKMLGVIDESTGQESKLYCLCHNCEQYRRQHGKRNRWHE